jgi:hypothetical protein
MRKLFSGWSLAVLALVAAGFVGVATPVAATLSLAGLAPYLGDRLEARVVGVSTGGEVSRLLVNRISSATVDLALESLETGGSYRVDVYIDRNGNGRYDRPPEDAAWRILLGAPADLSFSTAAESMVDIDWPPAADGAIGFGEYRNVLVDPETGMTLLWQNDATTLYVGLVSPGTGWGAVGFGAENKMAGANIVIGVVTEGTLTLQDHFGTGPVSHRADKASSLLQRAGSEFEGETVLEFALPLASSDPEDVSLSPGQGVVVILAFHATSDDLTKRHTGRSTVGITLDP